MGAFDVAIVGGGLVGTAVAYGLARQGARIAVLDEGDVAFRASRGNFGLVWVQSKGLGMPEYAAWTKASSDAWAGLRDALRDETGIDTAFARPGGFHVCLTDGEMERRREQNKRLHNQPDMVPYEVRFLDRKDALDLLPGLGPEVVGVSYCPLDGHANPLKLLRALHAALARRGAAYRSNTPVQRIERSGDAFALTTPAGTILSGKLILAAGLGNARLAPMVGMTAPVRPQRGQILVTERVAPFLKHPLVTVRQTDEGSVMIGDSLEEAGFDDRVGHAVVAMMADRAVKTFPALRGVRVVRTWGALRVMTPDGFPIYQQSAEHPGAFLVTCHSGVTLAAGHALNLAPHVAAGCLPDAAFAAFSARRFDVRAAA
ncbi:MAG: FAD-binding oxidoreductase [Alphaproteobacteria bacterium]|nr:FAD-binding oxidoreductase [Alphaproteobacteria bacterium]